MPPVEPTKLTLADVRRDAPGLWRYLVARAKGETPPGSYESYVDAETRKAWLWSADLPAASYVASPDGRGKVDFTHADVLAHERAATRPAFETLPESVRKYAAWFASDEPDCDESRDLYGKVAAAGYRARLGAPESGTRHSYGMCLTRTPDGPCDWTYSAAEIRAATASAQPAPAAPPSEQRQPTLADVPRALLEVYREYLGGVSWSSLYKRADKCRGAWTGNGSLTLEHVAFTEHPSGRQVRATRAELEAFLAATTDDEPAAGHTIKFRVELADQDGNPITFKELKDMGDKTTITETLKQDAADAAWRTAGSQFVKLTRDPLCALLSRHLPDDSPALRNQVSVLLSTELGSAAIAALLSVAVSATPGAPERLARELRVRALSGGADVAMELVMGPLRELMATTLRGVPELDAEPAALGAPAASVVSMPRAAAKVAGGEQ